MSKIASIAATCFLACGVAAAQSISDPYGPFNLDGGKVACRSASGDEIKKTQWYEAPQDRYFSDFQVSTVSGVSYVGPATCSVSQKLMKKVKLKLENGLEIDVDVPYKYEVLAHADCGSGEARTAQHIARGDHISIECTVMGQTSKYIK